GLTAPLLDRGRLPGHGGSALTLRRRGMLTFDYLLAAVLLAAPADRDVAVGPDLFGTVGPAVQQLALKWEILDPREVRYVLTRPEDFAADLKLLQRRYPELANAPPVNDCLRFPDRS